MVIRILILWLLVHPWMLGATPGGPLATRRQHFRGAAASLANSLSAYWKLDEASGTRVDSKGTVDLEDNSTVGSEAAKVGNGATFVVANSEFLSKAEPNIAAGNSIYSMSGWFKVSAVTGTQTLLSKATDSSTGEFKLYLNNAALTLTLHDDTGMNPITQISGTTIVVDTWYFVAAGHENVAPSTTWISVNGGAAETSVYESATPQTGSSSALRLGATQTPATEFLGGVLDEWGWWTRQLTAEEITYLYNAGAARTYNPVTGRFE